MRMNIFKNLLFLARWFFKRISNLHWKPSTDIRSVNSPGLCCTRFERLKNYSEGDAITALPRVPYSSVLSKPWDFSFLAMSIRCFLAASMPCPTSLLLRRRASSNSFTASQDRRKLLVTRAPISLIRSAYRSRYGCFNLLEHG